jgi:hypothetical protein
MKVPLGNWIAPPEEIGAVEEVTKPPDPRMQRAALGDSASQAGRTCSNTEQAPKQLMQEPARPTFGKAEAMSGGSNFSRSRSGFPWSDQSCIALNRSKLSPPCEHLLTNVVREICMLRSVGTGERTTNSRPPSGHPAHGCPYRDANRTHRLLDSTTRRRSSRPSVSGGARWCPHRMKGRSMNR